MQVGRKPTADELKALFEKERSRQDIKSAVTEELARMEVDDWLVYESDSTAGAFLGSIAIGLLSMPGRTFDVQNMDNKTFVHRKR